MSEEFANILEEIEEWYLINIDETSFNNEELFEQALKIGSLCDLKDFQNKKCSNSIEQMIILSVFIFSKLNNYDIASFLLSSIKSALIIYEKSEFFINEDLFHTLERKTYKNIKLYNINDIYEIFSFLFKNSNEENTKWYTALYALTLIKNVDDEKLTDFAINIFPTMLKTKIKEVSKIKDNALLVRIFNAGKKKSKFVRNFAKAIPLIFDSSNTTIKPPYLLSKEVLNYFLSAEYVCNAEMFLKFITVALDDEDFKNDFVKEVNNIFEFASEKGYQDQQYIPIMIDIVRKCPRKLPKKVFPSFSEVGVEVDEKELN